jgi:hypothetical protein
MFMRSKITKLQKQPLRRITYKLAGTPESGDVLSLLFHCPFFFLARIVPPMSVVNDFLIVAAEKPSTSGGDCLWEPFQLDAVDYANLVIALRSGRFKAIAEPRWVRTHQDWKIWCEEVVWGIPTPKRRRLEKKIAALEREIDEPDISDERVVKLLKELFDLRSEDVRYFSENKSRKPKLPLFKVQ